MPTAPTGQGVQLVLGDDGPHRRRLGDLVAPGRRVLSLARGPAPLALRRADRHDDADLFHREQWPVLRVVARLRPADAPRAVASGAAPPRADRVEGGREEFCEVCRSCSSKAPTFASSAATSASRATTCARSSVVSCRSWSMTVAPLSRCGADDPSHPNMYRMSLSTTATFGTATLERSQGLKHLNGYRLHTP